MARRNAGNTMLLTPNQQQGFQGGGQNPQNWNPQQQPWSQQGIPGTTSYQIPAHLTPTRKGGRLEVTMPQGSAPPRQLLIHGQFGTQRVNLSQGSQGGQYVSTPPIQQQQQAQPYQGPVQNFGPQGNLSPQTTLAQLAQTAEQVRQSTNQLARGIKQAAQQNPQMGGGIQTYNQARSKRNRG